MDTNSVAIALDAVRPHLFDFLIEHGIISGDRPSVRDQFSCPNPNHNDSTPSANLVGNNTKGHCHGCKKSFDIVQVNHWLNKAPMTGFGFISSNLTPLCEKYEIEFELGDLSEEDRFRIDSLRACRMVADYITNQLWTEEQEAYVDSRGLSTEVCRNVLSMGVVPNYDAMYQMLRETFSAVFLRDVGFGRAGMFSPNQIIFVIKDDTGLPVGFISRDITWEAKKAAYVEAGSSGRPPRKYDSSSDKNRLFFKRKLLFGLDLCVAAGDTELYVFEGQFDWATAVASGLTNSVALGGSSLTPEHIALFRKHGVDTITLVMDGDEVGQQTLEKLLVGEGDTPGMLTTASFLRPFVVNLPEGEDPSSYIVTHGVEKFTSLQRQDSFEWALNRQDPQADPIKACETMLPFILREPNFICREGMVLTLSELTGLSVDGIQNEITRREDTAAAIAEREKDEIVEEALRLVRYGEDESSEVLRNALERIEAIDQVTSVDTLGTDETLHALEIQMEKEEALEGPQGFRYGHLTHLQEDLNGECEGTVIAIGGVANTGKCQRFDSMVLLADGSFKTIESIVKEEKGSVLTMGPDLRINPGKVSNYYDSGIIPTLDLCLDSGLESHPSLRHPYLTPDGWRKASELNVGDHVAIAKRYRCFDNLDSPLNQNEIVVLASLLAEGGLTSGLKFTNQDPELRSLFMNACEELWDGIHFRMEGKEGITICVSDPGRANNRAIDFCRKHEIFGRTSKEKLIPQDVFRCSKSDLSLFLSVFYACDGWVHNRSDKHGAEVAISLANKEMVVQLRHLLLRFNLLSKIKFSTSTHGLSDQKFNRWTIALRDYDSLSSFSAQIGFPLITKQRKLDTILEEGSSARGRYQSYPVWEQVEEAIAKMGVSFTSLCRKAFGEKKVWSEDRWKLTSAYRPRKGEPLSSFALSGLAFALEDMDLINLIDGDIIFDKIVSIEDGGLQQCYDLTVPGTHNFIAEDIIVHNTAIQSQLAKELVENNEDTIVIVQTIDDTRQQFNRRLVVQFAQEEAEKRGMPLAEYITINKIANPKFWEESDPTGNKGLSDLRMHGYGELMKYIKQGRLHIKDTTHGPTLGLLERLIKKTMKDHPGMKIAVILDNFHKTQDFANLDERSSVKKRSQKLKTNIAQGLKVCVFSTFEYRKVEAGKRPTAGDLRDAVNIRYDINYLTNLFSPLNAAQDVGEEAKCDLWHGSEFNRLPIIEGANGKNKITALKATRHYKFYPAQSRYECLSPKETAAIVASNRSSKAESQGHNGTWNGGSYHPNKPQEKLKQESMTLGNRAPF